MRKRNSYKFAVVSVAVVLASQFAMADVVHREFSKDNLLVKVTDDDWQPQGFDDGAPVPAAYLPQVDITLDGRDTEAAWLAAKEVIVPLEYGDVSQASVKAFYTDEEVFIRVRWADDTMDKNHRPWVWDAQSKKYVPGQQVEDSLLLSFEAGCEWNPSILAGFQYDFDGWHWLAARSDPVSQAWDLIGNLSRPRKDGLDEHKYESRSRDNTWILKFDDVYPGENIDFRDWSELDRRYLKWQAMPSVTLTRHLDRSGGMDGSEMIAAPNDPPSNQTAVYPRFKATRLEGSAGEVGAKGNWDDGFWTVEFRRSRVTSDKTLNDTVFNRMTQFSVHIFDHTERVDQSSESGRLFLEFEPPESQLVSN